jgi:hypothetical protein
MQSHASVITTAAQQQQQQQKHRTQDDEAVYKNEIRYTQTPA